MKRLALDAGFAAGSRPELRTALFRVVHEPLEAPALSTRDDEVRGAGFAAVHELEALAAPPGELSRQLGVDRDLARPLAMPALGFERPPIVLRVQIDASERLGFVVDVSPAQTADLPFTHACEQRQSGEDAGLRFGCDQPNDVVESVRLPRSTPMLSAQEAPRQDAWVDEHELFSASVAARRAKKTVDVRDVLLA